jgi:hypothetical protein
MNKRIRSIRIFKNKEANKEANKKIKKNENERSEFSDERSSSMILDQK